MRKKIADAQEGNKRFRIEKMKTKQENEKTDLFLSM